MEVFALICFQIGLLCLQIVIIAAPVTISYGDSALVLDRKVLGNQMVRVVFPAPSPATRVGGRGCHEPILTIGFLAYVISYVVHVIRSYFR